MILSGLLGVAIGSFLNVCSDRLPAGKSLVYPPSHCDACGHRLTAKDLLPIFGYLRLRGRCRYCRAPVPRRVLWVELGTGLMFAFLYGHYGLSVEFAVTAFYGCLFIVLMVIDLEHRLILNKIVYPAAVAALIISAFLPQPGIVSFPWPEFINGAINSVIGGTIGLVLLLIPAVISRGGMGWGDVKMAGLVGLATGSQLVFVALFLGIVLGGLVAGMLLLLRIKKRKEAIPFGPFLSVATIAALVWGNEVLNWYLGML